MPPQRRSGRGSRRRALRVLFHASELSVTIRGILLADVLAHLLQFEPHRGHRVAASPEAFARESSSPFRKAARWQLRCFLSKNRSPTLPDASAESRCTCARGPASSALRQIWHSFCFASAWNTGTSCRRIFPKIAFRRRLGTNTTWYLQSHLEWARL